MPEPRTLHLTFDALPPKGARALAHVLARGGAPQLRTLVVCGERDTTDVSADGALDALRALCAVCFCRRRVATLLDFDSVWG